MLEDQALLWEHFKFPRHVGTLTPAVNVVYARSGSQAIESLIEWYWQINSQNGTVQIACYQVYGDMVTIALCSWLSEWVTNKSHTEILAFSPIVLKEKFKLTINTQPQIMAVYQSLLAVLGEWKSKCE